MVTRDAYWLFFCHSTEITGIRNYIFSAAQEIIVQKITHKREFVGWLFIKLGICIHWIKLPIKLTVAIPYAH